MHIAVRLLRVDHSGNQLAAMLQPDPVSHRDRIFANLGRDPIGNGFGLVDDDAFHASKNAAISHFHIGTYPVHGSIQRGNAEMHGACITDAGDILPVLANNRVRSP